MWSCGSSQVSRNSRDSAFQSTSTSTCWALPMLQQKNELAIKLISYNFLL